MDLYELAAELADEIVTHARESTPEEACGIIAGAGNSGCRLYRGRNVSPTPKVAFALDPETLARQLDFEDAGLAMTAIYHSHPVGPETPSPLDICQASEGYPDSITIICCLAEVNKPVLRAFRIVDARVREISLVPTREVTTLTNQSPRNTLRTQETRT